MQKRILVSVQDASGNILWEHKTDDPRDAALTWKGTASHAREQKRFLDYDNDRIVIRCGSKLVLRQSLSGALGTEIGSVENMLECAVLAHTVVHAAKRLHDFAGNGSIPCSHCGGSGMLRDDDEDDDDME